LAEQAPILMPADPFITRPPLTPTAFDFGLAAISVAVLADTIGPARGPDVAELGARPLIVASFLAANFVTVVPISITYRDPTGCVAAYANPEVHEPLDLGVAGFIDEKMALRSGGYTYFQEGDRVPGSSAPAPQIPYAHYPFVQTTWKKWREDHPDTDIYIGEGKDHFVSPYK
jgi:hypothetical protein